MKKMILAVLTLGIAGASVESARAGDHEWAIAGKVLTGLVAASVVTHAVQAEPCSTGYYYANPSPVCGPTYYYAPPPVVYVQPAPPPVVVYRPPVVCVGPPALWVAPAPIVNFRFGFGGHYGHYRRW